MLSVGYNRQGWSSKQNGKKTNNKRTNPLVCTVHSEVDALLKVANKEEIKGSTVYVVRLGRNEKFALSKPCDMCEVILREHGVKKVVFTVDNDPNTHGVMDLRQ